jgi:hypothetical protein
MALDPRILLTPTTPNLMDALTQGISAGQALRQAPIIEALQRQKLEQGRMAMDAQRKLAQTQQAETQSAIAAQRGSTVNRFAQALKQLPQDQRSAALQSNRRMFDELGINVDRFTDLSDSSLDRVIVGTSAFAPSEKSVLVGEGQRLVGAQTGRTITEGAEKKKDVGSMVKDFRSRHDKLNQDFRDVDAAFRKVNTASDNAQGDMSLIFGFMKLLDPGSTVREGEFANAEQATGVPGRIINLYNRALEGTRLGETQRSGFVSEAQKLFDAQQASADEGLDILLSQVDEEDLSRQRVIGKKALSEFNQRKSARQKSSPKDLSTLSDDDLLSF